MSKVERFIIEASFPIRVLICLFGLGVIGFMLGAAGGIAELLRIEWAKVLAVLAYAVLSGVNIWAYFRRGRRPLSILGAAICVGLGVYALTWWP